jgi:putative protease
VHLSVQANAVNWADVKFWHRMGLTRVILSRELSLDEIEKSASSARKWNSKRSARRAVHRLFGPPPAVRLFQPPRSESGHVHQFLPLGLSGEERGRRRYGDLGRMEVIPLNPQRAIEEADARPFSTLHQKRATRWPTVLI